MNKKYIFTLIIILLSIKISFLDTKTKKKPNKNKKYRISSISKTFETLYVFKAVEKGKLDLNETIKKNCQA